MAVTDFRKFVRSEFLSISERELLQRPPGVLLGVSPAAQDQLAELDIHSVFDLALSRIFAAARHLTGSAGSGEFSRFGVVPSDVVDPAEVAGKQLDQLQFELIAILNGIGDADAVSAALLVKTVRDLALWPPYRAARRILNSVINPGQDSRFDPEAPAELVPTAGRYPTERVFYNANFLIDIDDDKQPVDLDEVGQINLSGKPRLLTKPARGAILTFAQSWFPVGLSLGQLLYSLPLAPGESTKLAVIDWRRKTATSLDEDVSQTEALSNTMIQSRAIAEVVHSVASEVQSGKSTINSTASAELIGLAGAGALPVPALVGGTASASANQSTTTGVFSSQGKRDIAASTQQQITDRTHQQAFSSRNRHATTVSEAVADERESISTRTVTNYNHMHALTVQYYEVVQLYRTELVVQQARRLLFIPFKLLDFRDDQVILRYRTALLAGTTDPYVRDLLEQATNVVNVSVELPRSAAFVPDPNESKHDQLADAKEAAKQRARDRAKMTIVFNTAKRAGGVLRVNDSGLTSWDMPGDASLVDAGWDPDTNRVQDITVNLESGVKIDITHNGTGSTGAAVNPDLTAATPVQQIASISVGITNSDDPQPQKIQLRFQVGQRRFSLPFDCVLPPGKTSARLATFASPVPISELASILDEQALLYSQIVWMNADPSELVMQMGNVNYRGKRLVAFIEPTPVAVLGNALGFIWNDEDDKDWDKWKEENASAPPKSELVPLPTDGVFAEAVLGRFNSAEKLDMSRFWNWQDLPIPIQAPDIAAIQAGQHEGVTPAPAGNLQAPVVNIMQPNPLPNPTGLGPALSAITASNMFRDMSGAAQLAAINQAALQAASSGATAAGAQAGANMATFAQFQVATLQALMPLIGAALGVPIAPAPGNSNITNAGAVANEAGKIDAANAATGTGGGASNVATGGAASGGSATGGGGIGTGGAGGSGGVGTGGAGGSATGGNSSATANSGGNVQSSNRQDVVRGTAGLPPTPTQATDRPVSFRFQFFDLDSAPLSGAIDIRITPDFGSAFALADITNPSSVSDPNTGLFADEGVIVARANGGHANARLRVPADDGSVLFELAGASDFKIPASNVVSFAVQIAFTPVTVTTTGTSDARTTIIDQDQHTLDTSGEAAPDFSSEEGADGAFGADDVVKIGAHAVEKIALALKFRLGYSQGTSKSTQTNTGGSTSEQQQFEVRRMKLALTLTQLNV